MVMIAMPLVMAISASPSGHLSDRWGSRWLSSLGLGITAVALGGMSLLSAGSPQPRRVDRQAPGDVLDAADGDVVDDDVLAGLGRRAVAALVDRDIDDDRAGLHRRDHF